MANIFKKLFSKTPPARSYRIPDGERIYAIGDIHGRLDLLENLLSQIEFDDAARSHADTTIIFLGDLIDRGPDSAGVIDAVIGLSQRRKTRVLCGNHEEMLMKSLENVRFIKSFISYGGRETAISYLNDIEEYNDLEFEEVRQRLLEAIPGEHVRFLKNLEDMITVGDYLFVHAGVRPGVPLEDQVLADLRWIREPFLSSNKASDFCVVHGHTITEVPTVTPSRIGIDTGAFQSGRLTALALEGELRWFLSSDQVA